MSEVSLYLNESGSLLVERRSIRALSDFSLGLNPVRWPKLFQIDRLGWLDHSRKCTARAEDAQGTPTQSHISPSIPVFQDK